MCLTHLSVRLPVHMAHQLQNPKIKNDIFFKTKLELWIEDIKKNVHEMNGKRFEKSSLNQF